MPERRQAYTGPQRVEVEALIKRAERLTNDELGILAFAWRAISIIKREEARSAARVVAVKAAQAASVNAVTPTAASGAAAVWASGVTTSSDIRAIAGTAAGDAVLALCIRHLIGQYGFEQDHYDELTWPWRALGSLHPADPEGVSDVPSL